MKTINIRFLLALTLISIFTGCLDQEFKDGKIQSIDNQGSSGSIISTAVTAAGSSEFYANAVDASVFEEEYSLIPVVLNSKDVAAKDIHIQMVPALDTLESYNDANGTNYVMPGGVSTPSFTLADGGLVTIPKGSSVGYLKIRTISADYFGVTQYAFAYRIESVQESGFEISGNHNFGIVALIPKNKYDGLYELNLETIGWSAYGISDNMPGDYGQVSLVTTGLTSCVFGNDEAGGNLQPGFTTNNATKTAFGATAPNFVFNLNDKVIDVFNSVPDDGRGRSFSINPAALATENLYDAGTKTFKANYLFHQNGRPDCTVKMIMTYIGPR